MGSEMCIRDRVVSDRDRIRTCDRLLRRQMLYPTELRVLFILIANIVLLNFKYRNLKKVTFTLLSLSSERVYP